MQDGMDNGVDSVDNVYCRYPHTFFSSLNKQQWKRQDLLHKTWFRPQVRQPPNILWTAYGIYETATRQVDEDLEGFLDRDTSAPFHRHRLCQGFLHRDHSSD